jgi:hypothetical protein
MIGLIEKGSYIKTRLVLSDGASVELDFPIEKMMDVIRRTLGVINPQNSSNAIVPHLSVQVVPVVAAEARSPLGSSGIILSLRDAAGGVHSFRLSEAESSLLREQMESAEESSQSRSGAKPN